MGLRPAGMTLERRDNDRDFWIKLNRLTEASEAQPIITERND
jgi:hypothetical protein